MRLHRGGILTHKWLKMLKQKVFVYGGEGADPNARDQLYRSLQKAVCPQRYDVELVSPLDLVKGDWKQSTALLAIGGGYDLGLIRALGDHGIRNIRDYVEEGGAYFGLCSGAYFGCDYIEFDKDGPLEVCGERHLKFYPGLGIGPVFPGFKYNTFAGAVATPLEVWDEQKLTSLYVYFNGGGYFKPYKESLKFTTDPISDFMHKPNHETISQNGFKTSESQKELSTKGDNSNLQNGDTPKGDNSNFQNGGTAKGDNLNSLVHSVEVLGKYTAVEGCPAAVVKTSVGKGVVILSGVHLEYNIDAYPEKDANVDAMMGRLKESEDARRHYFCTLVKYLRLVCRENISD